MLIERTSKKNKALMKSGELRPTKKPDIDNLIKSLTDGLNGVASKYYSEVPRVELVISQI